MHIEAASVDHLDAVVSWVTSERQCRLWAGPSVSYPIEMARLIDQIAFVPADACVGTANACAGAAGAYVGTDSSGVLAFGQIIHPEQGCPHLARIITNPEIRGLGIGRQFCLGLIARALEFGGRGVTLRVYRENRRALRLYQSLGFVEQDVKQDGNYDAGTVFMLKSAD